MNLRVGKKIVTAAFAAVFVLAGGLFFVKDALAAAGQLYLSPASSSVQNGSNVSVTVRLNPGTSADTVTVNVGYDPSKLRYASTDYSGSPYSTQIGASTTSNSISFTSAELSGTPVTTDAKVATLTFTALIGTGSSSLTLSGNAANAGTATNPGTAGATVTFTSPAVPTCPAGQTGTPPNCTTPSTGGSGSGSGSGGTSSTKGSGSSGTGASSGGKAAGPGPTSAATSQPSGTPATVTDKKVQYTQAVLSFSTNVPTQAYVRFGIDGQLTATTPADALATTHAIAIDPAQLVPGQTYSYVVVSTDASGNVSQSAVQTFATKGLKVKVSVFDANHKPLAGKTVVLHSTPQTAKTDANGNATFDNVAPGAHHVIYTVGKKNYDQQVAVINDVQTTGDAQTAETQNFAVVYGITQSGLQMSAWIWICVIVLIIAAVLILAQTGRLGIALQLHHTAPGAPLISQPIVIGDANGSGPPVSDRLTSGTITPTKIEVTERLNSIPDPAKPLPGSTIAPRSESDEPTDGPGTTGQ